MAKNKEVFEYQAKISVDTGTLGQQINQVRKSLQDLEFDIKIPKGLKEDLHIIENRLFELQRTAPGAGSSSKDMVKYSNAVQKLAGELSIVSEKMHGIEIPDSAIKDSSKKLQDLTKQLKAAQKDLDDAFKDVGAKLPAIDEKAMYKREIEAAKNNALKEAKKGKKGDVSGAFNEIRGRTDKKIAELESKENLTDNQKLVLEKAKASKASIELLEKEILLIQTEQKRRADKVNKLQVQQSTEANAVQAKIFGQYSQIIQPLDDAQDALTKITADTNAQAEAQRKVEESAKAFDATRTKIKNLFSATTVFYTLRRVVNGAINDFQELDKQFNEIAIVSDYSTKEMWQGFAQVNKIAQQFGVTTKNVLEVQNLYYHQGKDMAEVNKLTAQTLTLAKITGMDYERATSDLTAALNAYNIAAEDAVVVTDSIAALDANAAISSEELMTALTKTASIAANAGMSLQSTEVFLTKMIETTREAPENLGTALKTIIARFGEVKQEINGEEIELADINKVDTALKSIGISLLDTAGQIRDLDDVFMELSAKWDDLDRNTQRYIATQAAGSRQQSRFIAMMEDYDRTLELTEIAQNSAGIGAKQLAKSMESMESSLNRLKSTFQEFYSNILSASFFKGLVDSANEFLSLLNELPGPTGAVVAALGFWAVKTFVIDKAMSKLGESIGEGITKNALLAKVLGITEEVREQEKKSIWAKIGATIKENAVIEANTQQIREQTAAIRERNNAEQEGNIIQFPTKKRAVSISRGENLGKLKINKKESFRDSLKGSFRSGRSKGAESMAQKLNIGGLSTTAKGAKASLKNLFTAAKGGLKGIATSISGSIGSLIGGLGTLLSVLWPVLAVVAAIGAAFAVWKVFFAASKDDTKKIEKLTEAQEKYNKSLTEYKNLQKNAAKYEELRYKKFKTAEQLQEEQEAAKAIVEEYPHLLDYIDKEGNYHLKNTDAINKEIEAKQRLAELSSETLTRTRLSNAKVGVYADENTTAGATMSSIQSFYGALDKKALKDIGKAVDEVANFDKSLFYDFAEAYASGEKASFNHKDFSNMFEGQIGEEEFNRLIVAYSENGGDIVDALEKSGAYNDAQINDIAHAWKILNQETSNLYSELFKGIGEEVENIYVQEAELIVENAFGQTDVNEKAKEGITNRYAEIKETAYKEQLGVQQLRKEQANANVADRALTIGLEGAAAGALTGGITAAAGIPVTLGGTALAAPAIVGLFSAIGGGLGYVGGTIEGIIENYEDWSIDVEEEAERVATETAEKFKKGLKNELKNADNVTALNNFYDSMGGKTLQEIQESNTFKEGSNLSTLVKTEIAEIEKQYADFQKKIADLNITIGGEERADNYYNQLIEGLTLDQLKRVEDVFSQMGDKAGAAFLEGIKQLEGKGYDMNKLLNIDLTSVDSFIKSIKEAGLSIEDDEEALQYFISAMGGLDALIFDDLTQGAEQLNERIEALVKNLEKISKLEAGEGDISAIADAIDYDLQLGNIKTLDDAKKYQEKISYGDNGAKMLTDADTSLVDTAMSATALSVGAAYNTIDKLNEKVAQGLELTQEEQIQHEQALGTVILGTAGIRQIAYEEWKAKQEGIIKGLKEEIEKLKEIRDAWQELVSYIREYDYYQNLVRVQDTFSFEKQTLEFEMDFSINPDVIQKDASEYVNLLNNDIAANQAGMIGADANAEAFRDSIERNYSDYINFDEAGNAILNSSKMIELQEKIATAKANGHEAEAEALELEKKNIEESLKAYDNARKKSQDYAKQLQQNFKDLESFIKETYSDLAKAEEKIFEVIKQKEDKHLEDIEKSYESIQKENDKYLDNLQKMVDEERRIRDEANRDEDIRDKEKKLAMMKMDTSGVYASDIRSLEKELEGDYQDREDTTVDNEIDKIRKQYETEQELREKDLEYTRNALEYKRESYANYQEEVNAILIQGAEYATNWLIQNDSSYLQQTSANQALLRKEYEDTMAKGVAANTAISKGLIEQVDAALQQCKTNAEGFNQGVKDYSTTATAANEEISGTVEEMAEHYSTLVGKVEGLDEAEGNLADAVDEVTAAVGRLNDAEQTHYIEEWNRIQELINQYKELAKQRDLGVGGGSEDEKSNFELRTGADNKTTIQGSDLWDSAGDWKEDLTIQDISQDSNGDFYAYLSGYGWVQAGSVYEDDKWGDGKPLTYFNLSDPSEIEDLKTRQWTVSDKTLFYKQKFAKGGYVDYTGPAWVDGTKSHPEYMLNATQTAQFESLIDALSMIYKAPKLSNQVTANSQKTGDSHMTFHINVEGGISSDYDVDRAVERIEKKILDSGKYRNTTVIKNSN